MGHCSISFENANIGNHKSDSKHTDNDWLGVIWTIDDQSIAHTFPVVDNTTGTALKITFRKLRFVKG